MNEPYNDPKKRTLQNSDSSSATSKKYNELSSQCPKQELKDVILPYFESTGIVWWKHIDWALQQLISCPENNTATLLIQVIAQYNLASISYWNFDALATVINKVLTIDQRAEFLEKTLPRMAKLALDLPMLMEGKSLGLLKKGVNGRHVLTKQQVASLLANAFFCTFPWRNDPKGQFENYPTINFSGLYQYYYGRSRRASEAKLLCLINYFKQVTSKSPEGKILFERKCLVSFPEWQNSEKLLQKKSVNTQSRGTIERNGKGMLQVTFANRKFGGGVLDSGSVQEEVRCITCPEMIVARLFAEAFEKNEAFFVFGAECYSHHSGYAWTFTYGGDFKDTQMEEETSYATAVVAIDAIDFSRSLYSLGIERNDLLDSKKNRLHKWVSGKLETHEHYKKTNTIHVQYHPQMIFRELNKAYVGFKNHGKKLSPQPVATGNWGCGAYQGDPILKFLLQFMATSESERDINYFTFGNDKLTKRINNLVNMFEEKQWTIGKLYVALIEYHRSKEDFYGYLMNCLEHSASTSNKPVPNHDQASHGSQLDDKYCPSCLDTTKSYSKQEVNSEGLSSQTLASSRNFPSLTTVPNLLTTSPNMNQQYVATQITYADVVQQKESVAPCMQGISSNTNQLIPQPTMHGVSDNTNSKTTPASCHTKNHRSPTQLDNRPSTYNTSRPRPKFNTSPEASYQTLQRGRNDSSGVREAINQENSGEQGGAVRKRRETYHTPFKHDNTVEDTINYQNSMPQDTYCDSTQNIEEKAFIK